MPNNEPLNELAIATANKYTEFGWQIARLVDAYAKAELANSNEVRRICIVIEMPPKGTLLGECCQKAVALTHYSDSDFIQGRSDDRVKPVESFKGRAGIKGPIASSCDPCQNP